MSSSTTTPERPWHEAFPAPRSTAASITREEVLRWFQEGKKPGKDFVLVDLRRVDHEVCTICLFFFIVVVVVTILIGVVIVFLDINR